jgi:hypothetical protein
MTDRMNPFCFYNCLSKLYCAALTFALPFIGLPHQSSADSSAIVTPPTSSTTTNRPQTLHTKETPFFGSLFIKIGYAHST